MKSMTAEQRNHMLLCDPVSSVIPKMAVPTIISMLITNIYNMADTFFVSQIGTSASGAVGVIFSAMAIIQAISFMIGMGSGTHVSQALGAGNKKKADTYASTAFFTAFIAGIILAFFSLTHIDFIVRFLGSTETIAPYAKDYATYIFYAMPFMMCSFVMNNLLRFEGLTMYGMVGITTGGILNMVLDPILIFGLNMGVRGAALATVISQGVSCVWVVSFLMGKKTSLRLKAQNMRIDMKLLAPCIALGLSAFIMQSTESIISVCFNSSLLKYGGDIAVGAMTILTSVMQFAMLPLQGLAQGAQPISSYNFGARNAARVRQTFFALLKASLTYSVILWGGIMLFPKAFAGIFTPDAELLAFTAKALRIYCGALFIFGIQIACQMTFVSIGNAPCSIIVAILRKFVLLIPLIFILPHILPDRTMAVYTAEPVADTLAVIFTMVMFGTQFRKALKKLEEA